MIKMWRNKDEQNELQIEKNTQNDKLATLDDRSVHSAISIVDKFKIKKVQR